jgi:hypothetical protein
LHFEIKEKHEQLFFVPSIDDIMISILRIKKMKYIALLRGINVGGSKKVEMKKLKALFESLGYENVLTYINSGNIIFESIENKESVRQEVERSMKKEYEKLKELGVVFTMEPTKVTGSTIAVFDDTCGNLIQINQLM